ncbi:MAG TPA: hypothetical protein VGF67_04085 [Ktedonobacteraceae bacterium]
MPLSSIVATSCPPLPMENARHVGCDDQLVRHATHGFNATGLDV